MTLVRDEVVSVDEDEEAACSRVRSVERLRLSALSFALALMIFSQSSGQTSADTKLDMVVDPIRFLLRALAIWDPLGKAGQLQNQAYGYLFPMGPFFAVAHWLGLAPWTSQRLWESALVVAAFVGMFCLSRALGVSGFWPPVAAGLVFAVAPRILGELTSVSAELTPTVALPWVLLPLVRGAQQGSPRRAAAWSGVALLFAGGTNAAATLAVLPIPALWLLTRQRGPRRRALMRSWTLCVFLASLWWIVPLLTLGTYSSPFLDWIESAQNTTATTSLSAVLRGVPHWENYLGPGVWPAGWIFVQASAAIIATTIVAAAGMAGLARRDLPNRLFLCSCLGLGVLVVTLGHAAGVGPPFSGDFRTLLDGPLVAFRNIHKFEPLVTFPLAVGVGATLSRLPLPRWHKPSFGKLELQFPTRAMAVGSVLVVAALAISPALANRLVSQPRSTVIAPWWPQAANWLAAHSGGTRTLIVPGAPRPTYSWGQTIDDAMQPVAQTPWIADDSFPLAQAGLLRLLRSVDRRLATGHSDPALADVLARAGIGFVLLRNDLEAIASGATQQDVARTTLDTSPGFTLATGIGPQVGGAVTRNRLIDAGAGGPRPAIEIFRVLPASGVVSLLPASGAVVATGSTDSLAQLAEAGLSPRTPVLFGTDGNKAGIKRVVHIATDGIRRQQASFNGRFSRSPTLTAGAPFAGSRAAYDFLPLYPGPLSTMRYIGIDDVTASSSGSDIDALVNLAPGSEPWSALDGDPATAWKSGSATGALGQWLQVRLARSISVPTVDVAFAAGLGPYPTQVEVTTDRGSQVDPVRPGPASQSLALPAGATRTIRIRVMAVAGGGLGASAGIDTLSIPGVTPERTLDVPDVGSPDIMNFSTSPGYSSGCLTVPGGVACQQALAVAGEEDGALNRSVRLTTANNYQVSATVRAFGGPGLNARLDAGLPIHARASSVDSVDPRHRPGAAVDGDPHTAWVAAPGDQDPNLTLDLGRTRKVRAIRIWTNAASPVAMPRSVRIQAGTETWTGRLPPGGQVTLPRPVATRTIKITILTGEVRQSIAMLDGRSSLLPVGINTVTVDDGVATRATMPTEIRFGCDSGLRARIDGIDVPLRVDASVPALLAGQALPAVACDRSPLNLASGPHEFRLDRTDWARPGSLTMTVPGTALTSPQATVPAPLVQKWSATNRRVSINTAVQSILVVHENFNRGWTARIDGHRLRPVQVDGWEQAFMVPAGTTGVVVLSYEPQRAFALGLLAGLIAAVAVVVLAFARARHTSDAPVGERRGHSYLASGVIVVLAGLLAGIPGLVVATIVLGLTTLLRPRSGVPVWLGAVLLCAAGLDIVLAPDFQTFATANSDVVQLLCVAAISVTLLGGVPQRKHDEVADP